MAFDGTDAEREGNGTRPRHDWREENAGTPRWAYGSFRPRAIMD
jgi:hypothetical protein